MTPLVLFLGGDVMTGRGVDQVLPHPSDPVIHELATKDARAYVRLAERAHGAIPAPVDHAYVWGDLLAALEGTRPDARIVNLETSVTRRSEHWKGKGINYRMHPANAPCLTAARIDCCALANNHVLDYGHAGLRETIETLRRAGVKTPGAGRDRAEARAPAVLDVPGRGRVIVFAFGTATSGIPPAWAATAARPGVNLLEDLSPEAAAGIGEAVRRIRRAGDVVVASIHWGGNWGFEVPDRHVRFAHALVEGGVDVVHGHSSHHVRPIELFEGRLVLYGCGDLLDDYEGIAGHEEFRSDLALAYLAAVDAATGRLAALRMPAFQIRNFRLRGASPADARWLRDTINRASAPFGFRVALDDQRIPPELIAAPPDPGTPHALAGRPGVA
jgi:poly-gamma-glutamate synthesis protein (capsule biosynthesis protein)